MKNRHLKYFAKTYFLSKDEFHTLQIKASDMHPFIREAQKSYFSRKNVYHCEIFNSDTQ